MGGQVLGGGIVVLVAVVLWLVYLLPSWYQRHQFDAAERNAVRLNQALRVLAETSETPDEVRLELSARTAAAQQKLARRAQAEREEVARKAQAERDELARAAQLEREALARDAQIARDALARRDLIEQEQAALRRAEAERAAQRAAAAREAALAAAAEREAAQRLVTMHAAAQSARQEAAARAGRTGSTPASVSPVARARRRARLTVTVIGMLALGVSGWGVLVLLQSGSAVPLAIGAGVVGACLLLLTRMARVSARAGVAAPRTEVPVRARVAREPQDLSLEDERAWQPRELPRPLTASAGSRAAAVLAGAAEREQLRQAALDEPLRERAERERPAELDTARLARMGHVDDAEIEAHVRALLRERAVG